MMIVQTLDRMEEITAAAELFARTWPRQPPATAGLLRALEHAGGYVAGVYVDGAMVGAAAAFLASHPTPGLHSHVAAVDPALRGQGIGHALKLHQRAWAAERGLQSVTWTFDPLVRRNAWFNIGKLGAGVAEYLVDFYGRMDDGVNDGDESDRMLAVWPVHERTGVHDRTGLHDRREGVEGAVAVLEEVGGRPVVHDVVNDVVRDTSDGGDGGEADAVTVATPPDVESLRHADPGLARAWRTAVREAIVPRFGAYEVTGFTRAGSYVLTRRG
jgi:predicted GNAT superfamily acetyltransferase